MARYSKEESLVIRNRIIDAAIAMIQENPLQEIPVRVLAKNANVSPTSLYNFFGSKGDLYVAIIQADFLGDLMQLDLNPDNHTDVFKIIDDVHLMGELFIKKDLFTKTLIRGVVQNIHELNTSALTELTALPLVEKLQTWIENGLIRDDVNVQLLATNMVNSVLSNIMLWGTLSVANEDLINRVACGLLQSVYPCATAKHADAIKQALDDILIEQNI